MLERDGFIDYLEGIVANIDDETTKGIAKLAIDKGIESLSEKQKYVLEKGLSDYVMLECPDCGDSIEFDNMEIDKYNGRCSYCQNRYEKIMSE